MSLLWGISTDANMNDVALSLQEIVLSLSWIIFNHSDVHHSVSFSFWVFYFKIYFGISNTFWFWRVVKLGCCTFSLCLSWTETIISTLWTWYSTGKCYLYDFNVAHDNWKLHRGQMFDGQKHRSYVTKQILKTGRVLFTGVPSMGGAPAWAEVKERRTKAPSQKIKAYSDTVEYKTTSCLHKNGTGDLYRIPKE